LETAPKVPDQGYFGRNFTGTAAQEARLINRENG
jgi:hypothetical protein